MPNDTDDLVPLAKKQRDQLTAVVLDANSMGGGNLDLEQLAQWAKRCSANAFELWIPEVVLDEWAEHAAKAFDVASAAASRERAELRKVGIKAAWPTDDREAVIEHVTKAVRGIPEVSVLDLDPQDAVEAVKDQLLQRSPGSRKKEVKTGAGDSALLRTVYGESQGMLDSVVLVTGDVAAVDGICDRLGWPRPIIVNGLHTLAAKLELLETANPAQALTLAQAIAQDVPASWANPHAEPSGAIDVDAIRNDGLNEAVIHAIPDEGIALQHAELLSIDRIVGLERVLVDESAGRYLAEAYFLCSAVAVTTGYNNDGTTVRDEHHVTDLLLRIYVRAEVTEGRLTVFDTSDDVGAVRSRDEGGLSPQGMLKFARQALAAVPGVGDGDFPPDNGDHLLQEVAGHQVAITASVEDDGWEVTAQVDGRAVATLRCQNSPARRWGYELFHLKVETGSGPSSEPVNPPWEFAAELLEALTPPAEI